MGSIISPFVNTNQFLLPPIHTRFLLFLADSSSFESLPHYLHSHMDKRTRIPQNSLETTCVLIPQIYFLLNGLLCASRSVFNLSPFYHQHNPSPSVMHPCSWKIVAVICPCFSFLSDTEQRICITCFLNMVSNLLRSLNFIFYLKPPQLTTTCRLLFYCTIECCVFFYMYVFTPLCTQFWVFPAEVQAEILQNAAEWEKKTLTLQNFENPSSALSTLANNNKL